MGGLRRRRAAESTALRCIPPGRCTHNHRTWNLHNPSHVPAQRLRIGRPTPRASFCFNSGRCLRKSWRKHSHGVNGLFGRSGSRALAAKLRRPAPSGADRAAGVAVGVACTNDAKGLAKLLGLVWRACFAWRLTEVRDRKPETSAEGSGVDELPLPDRTLARRPGPRVRPWLGQAGSDPQHR